MNSKNVVVWMRLHLPTASTVGSLATAACVALTFCSRDAAAQVQPEEAPPPPPPQPQEVPPPSAAPVRYSVPFQLRPVTAQTSVRTDTSFGAYQNTLAQSGFAVVSELIVIRQTPSTENGPRTGLVPLVKFTVVNDSPPGTAKGGFAFV